MLGKTPGNPWKWQDATRIDGIMYNFYTDTFDSYHDDAYSINSHGAERYVLWDVNVSTAHWLKTNDKTCRFRGVLDLVQSIKLDFWDGICDMK